MADAAGLLSWLEAAGLAAAMHGSLWMYRRPRPHRAGRVDDVLGLCARLGGE